MVESVRLSMGLFVCTLLAELFDLGPRFAFWHPGSIYAVHP